MKDKKLKEVVILASILLIISISFLGFDMYRQNSENNLLKTQAISVSKNSDMVKQISNFEIESDVRKVEKSELEDYPVIFEGASASSYVVTHSSDSGSVICVVDNGVQLKCFNSINIG